MLKAFVGKHKTSRLLSQFLCQFQATSKTAINDSFLRTLKSMPPSAASVYFALLLHAMGSLSHGALLMALGSALESSIGLIQTPPSVLHFLYATLANELGTISPTPSKNDLVAPSSELYAYLPYLRTSKAVPLKPVLSLWETRQWWYGALFSFASQGSFLWGYNDSDINDRLYDLLGGDSDVYTGEIVWASRGVRDWFYRGRAEDADTQKMIWEELCLLQMKGFSNSEIFQREVFRGRLKDMSRVMSSFVPSQPEIRVAAEAGKLSDSEPSFPIIELGDSLLEILTFQILICCHLKTQDCLFVVRGVQIFALQSGPTADECLLLLLQRGVNVRRAIKLSTLLYSRVRN